MTIERRRDHSSRAPQTPGRGGRGESPKKIESRIDSNRITWKLWPWHRVELRYMTTVTHEWCYSLRGIYIHIHIGSGAALRENSKKGKEEKGEDEEDSNSLTSSSPNLTLKFAAAASRCSVATRSCLCSVASFWCSYWYKSTLYSTAAFLSFFFPCVVDTQHFVSGPLRSWV